MKDLIGALTIWMCGVAVGLSVACIFWSLSL
jgi:hypothetical protein